VIFQKAELALSYSELDVFGTAYSLGPD